MKRARSPAWYHVSWYVAPPEKGILLFVGTSDVTEAPLFEYEKKKKPQHCYFPPPLTVTKQVESITPGLKFHPNRNVIPLRPMTSAAAL